MAQLMILGSITFQVELPDSSKLMFAYGRFCRAEVHMYVQGVTQKMSFSCFLALTDFFMGFESLLDLFTDMGYSSYCSIHIYKFT